MVDPFRSLIDEIGLLNQGNPQGTQHAEEILRLYSTLWECFIMKRAEVHDLEKENEMLRASNIQLCQELETLERRHIDKEALLACYGRIHEKVREEIVRVLSEWNGCSPYATLETSANGVGHMG
ncbi:uncharacterized protein N7484_008202 [Penicillium longicatenatum]|uniref:uncharacterized protein n=1 Tax=Penicillium longicatenatum TaxID=1561947 RepID=UPI002548FC41|nr:uncharacterized protein N7484_008202 [Penicillium longicatenatum]KAJ5640340.1 hypothetical protein N7484_008202 [Penicillium longicatenatum]